MAQVTLILILLLAVVASSVVSRLVPLALPRPLVQIAMGALIGAATSAHVAFDPEVFFVLFIPPLLFLDGWRIPKDAVYRDRKTILGLALGLVFLTVIGIGFFLHWLIPQMPLGVAFALAAVISPTDPIAVSAIAQRTPVPSRLMHILEGESMLNDASGLVCLRFALAAVMTGSFSLSSAFVSFLWMAIGGAAIGATLMFVVMRVKGMAGLRFGDDPGSNILIGILIPFAAYIAADRAGTSGILAVVAAGVTMSYTVDSDRDLASTRIRSRAVWDMIQFALNGVIFVLLGNQLPVILSGLRATAEQGGHREPAWLALYVVVIVAALGLLRFGWAWLSLQLTLFRARRRGDDPSRPADPDHRRNRGRGRTRRAHAGGRADLSAGASGRRTLSRPQPCDLPRDGRHPAFARRRQRRPARLAPRTETSLRRRQRRCGKRCTHHRRACRDPAG